MDQDVINLAKAIRQRESNGNFNAVGDAGTSKGGYQWQAGTWKEHARKVLGNENAEMTPDNQNAVAYGVIKEWKDKGLNPAQIAAKWNSGQSEGWENKVGVTTINGQKIKYDVPAYVKEVTDTYQSFKAASMPKAPEIPQKTQGQIADEEHAAGTKPWFASDENDSPLMAGAKSAGNVLPSAFNFAKGALDMLNPVSTYKKIKEIVSGTKELAAETGGLKNAFGAIAKEVPGTVVKTLVPEGIRDVSGAIYAGATGSDRFGTVDENLKSAQRNFVNDPFGTIAPVLLTAKAGAKGVDTMRSKSAMSDYVKNIDQNYTKPIPKPSTTLNDAFETGMSKTSELVTKPTAFVANKVGGGISGAFRGGIEQATGLNRGNAKTIIENPEAFTKENMARTDRASLGRQIQSELAKLADEKSTTGKEYGVIRTNNKPIKVDADFFDNTIKETTGLKIKGGKLLADTNSKIRDTGDLRALQNVYDLWHKTFKKGEMTANEYLNLREDLAKAAKFEKDIGARKDVQVLTGQIRAKLNEAYRPQVEGLKDLDATMSEQIASYKELARGLVDKEGTITDAGMAKIANLSKDKPNLAIQLEKIMPGITKQVEILKVVNDIERASGIKVGTYTKGAIVGGGLAFGGPIQAIINMILTSPQLAVPILRQYGLIKNSAVVKAVVNAIRAGGDKVNNLPEKIPANPTVFGRQQELIGQ